MKRYIKLFFRDFLIVLGFLTVTLAGWMMFDTNLAPTRELIWPMVLMALALSALKYLFLDVDDTSEREQLYSHIVFSLLAGIALMVVLMFFTPGGKISKASATSIVIVLLGAKSLNDAILYWSAKSDAQKINQQLGNRPPDSK